MKVGIVGYGAYVPDQYLEIDRVDERAKSLGLKKKAVAGWDEDSVTMAVEAGREALRVGEIDAREIGAVYVGSESPPYAVKPSSTIVADVLGVRSEYKAMDMEFACKAATAGIQAALAQVESNGVRKALVIGADVAQAEPGDVLELSAGAAAAAVVLGTEGVIAEVEGYVSVASDLPDFWRREGEKYPQHGGRFSGEPAYFDHVERATRGLMRRMQVDAADIDQVVLHMPNGKFPMKMGQDLGFDERQLKWGMMVTEVGNPYSAAVLLGLVRVLSKIGANKRILITSYGSGAGADSILLKTTEWVERKRFDLDIRLNKRRKIGWQEYLERQRQV